MIEAKKARGKALRATPQGNPLFRLCHVAGGTPELLKIDQFPTTYNRCKFKDGSFIDLGSLQTKR